MKPSAEADAGLLGVIANHEAAWHCRADTIRIALSRPATPPLDVERLAEVIEAHPRNHGWTVECAKRIAREYAALANPTPEPEG